MTPNPDPARPSVAGLLAMNRRRFLLASSGALVGATLFGCSSDDGSPAAGSDTTAAGGGGTGPEAALAPPGSPGLMDEALYQERIEEYLTFATTESNPSNPTNVAAHLLRAQRDPEYRWAIDEVTVEAMEGRFERIDEWLDTRDFDLMYMIWLLDLGRGETEATRLDPALLEAIEQRLVDNRYRYDDPLPGERIDNLWFWSENHLIIGYTIEYLAGRRLPDETFTVTGLTGTEHAERARVSILEWIHERVELGFFEWHSNVYMLKNITPLIMLAELTDDAEIIAAAGVGLDLCLLDMAAHNHRGTYAAPRGRTYKKDKMSALDEATFGTARFLFGDTSEPYENRSDGGATYLCAAARYRPPQLIIDMALDDTPGVTRERHGVPFPSDTPLTENPEAPYGRDFEDPANLAFWWSLGAVGMWPLARVGVATAEEHRLWDTELFEQIKLMAMINDYDPEKIREWLHPRTAAINFGFLGEAHTYAYRDEKVSLASVIDHRPGEMRDQAHSWQATIDEHALVFTNHPVTEVDQSTEWRDDGRPGYWTGEASMPRSAQFERTAIHLYLPAWDESTDPLVWSVLGYQPYTHAYVPQDHFDEVRQEGNWTVVSRGGAHIALWSWRTPTWREHDPAVVATRDMVLPFDLVAEGGPDNVWLVEVSDGSDGDLDAFVAAVTAAEPEVDRHDDGFDVAWTSPSAGRVEFSSTGDLLVDGEAQAIADFPRHHSRFGTVDHLATRYALEGEGSRWEIDARGWDRQVS